MPPSARYVRYNGTDLIRMGGLRLIRPYQVSFRLEWLINEAGAGVSRCLKRLREGEIPGASKALFVLKSKVKY